MSKNNLVMMKMSCCRNNTKEWLSSVSRNQSPFCSIYTINQTSNDYLFVPLHKILQSESLLAPFLHSYSSNPFLMDSRTWTASAMLGLLTGFSEVQIKPNFITWISSFSSSPLNLWSKQSDALPLSNNILTCSHKTTTWLGPRLSTGFRPVTSSSRITPKL